MDKYYTPEISEFFVGFEYETSYLQDYDTWKKEILEEDDAGYFQSIYSGDAIPTEFRVKYLDKEDIESLGWKVFSDYGAGIEFKFEDKWKLVKVKYEGLTYSKNEIRIFENNSIFGEDYTSRLFIGNIKNKSELIKLLKQLQIG